MLPSFIRIPSDWDVNRRVMSQSHFVFQKNNQIYVDGLHKDYIEVFDKNEKIYAYDELIIKYINEEKEYILLV